MLMAELEGLEGDEGRAREWMARALNAARDPAWTADGFVSDRWLPVSPVSGRLDAFQWKVPVADLGERRIDRGGSAGSAGVPRGRSARCPRRRSTWPRRTARPAHDAPRAPVTSAPMRPRRSSR